MRRVVSFVAAGVFVCFAGAAAQQPEEGAAQSATATEKPAPVQPRPVGSVLQLMDAMVVPASDVVFEAVRIEVNDKGWEEIYPKTHEEWVPVLKNAVVLAEAGNLLMIRGRRGSRDKEEGWMAMAKQLSDGAALALKAGTDNDPKMFNDASETIRQACFKCHVDYAPRRTGNTKIEPF